MDCDDDCNNNLVAAPLHKPIHQHNDTTNKKRVSFRPLVAVREVMSRHDYTVEELEESFYDADDLEGMKQTARYEGRLLREGLLPASVSTRGLEHKTRAGSRRKRQSRLNAYAAVFFEIDYQIQENLDDPEAIADAYHRYSEPCAVRAQKIGAVDALQASMIYRR